MNGTRSPGVMGNCNHKVRHIDKSANLVRTFIVPEKECPRCLRAEIERLQKRDDERTGTINEAMADEIEKLRDECPRGVVFGWCCKDQAKEIERLRAVNRTLRARGDALLDALRRVQFTTISKSMGSSAYPTCVGCGAQRFGALSGDQHKDNCLIQSALTAAEAVGGSDG